MKALPIPDLACSAFSRGCTFPLRAHGSLLHLGEQAALQAGRLALAITRLHIDGDRGAQEQSSVLRC